MSKFKLQAPYKPTGDQPQAIEALVKGFREGNQFQTLLGVTGSGKTFTMANIIQQLQKPTLVIAHNKTLAGQLYGEFKEFFPENAVEYFVSYYDYYQPEAYVPSTDTYIAKDSSINDEIDKLRLSATASLTERRDVVVVASVSCIYGLGSPEEYAGMSMSLRPGMQRDRDEVIRGLIEMQYDRNDLDLGRCCFRVRGDVVEVYPAQGGDYLIRIEFFGDEIERIAQTDPLTGQVHATLEHVMIYPASHYVVAQEKIQTACKEIEKELEDRVKYFKSEDKLLEAQRVSERTNFDIEMLRETGFCSGIENYSRHLNGMAEGEPPFTLLDYFTDDFLIIIDESHMTIPQIRGMYAGDRSRKNTLVDYGFRLPSALDNRPLNFGEFEQHHKVLVTTLTKRMAEDLTAYMNDVGIRVKYLHSDVDTLERAEIIRDMRLDVFDVLVGINLLREGLDIPEISLVAILDADKEGFLRSETSLIQTIGRAARNSEGHVIMYADNMTDSMRAASTETNRRREIQQKYNEEHGITPQTIRKAVRDLISISKTIAKEEVRFEKDPESMSRQELEKLVKDVEKQMKKAAADLNFEAAADLRDRMVELKSRLRDFDK